MTIEIDKPSTVQEVHRTYDERYVGSVIAGSAGKLLLWDYGVPREDVNPCL